MGNGSCELIVHAGVALLDPGTTIVHAQPSFAMYPHLAAEAGAEAIAVPLAPDGGHDLDAMAAAVDERTRLLIICNPNNPTGVYRSADEVERFGERQGNEDPAVGRQQHGAGAAYQPAHGGGGR